MGYSIRFIRTPAVLDNVKIAAKINEIPTKEITEIMNTTINKPTSLICIGSLKNIIINVKQ